MKLRNVTNLVKRNEEMENIRNFGAFAIVLENQMAKPLKKEYEAVIKRLQAQNQNVKLIVLKNDEVSVKIFSQTRVQTHNHYSFIRKLIEFFL